MRAKLKKIKEDLEARSSGPYALLLKHEWEEAVSTLGSYGSALLRDIEKIRTDAHQTNFGFLSGYQRIRKLNQQFNEVSEDFELFFDAGMLWLRAIIDGNTYEDHQILQKKNVEGLINQCQKGLEYLNNLVSSKRTLFFTYLFVLLSTIAIGIAVLSFIFSLRY